MVWHYRFFILSVPLIFVFTVWALKYMPSKNTSLLVKVGCHHFGYLPWAGTRALHYTQRGCSLGVQNALEGTACCITTTDTFDTQSKSAWPNHRWMWELPGSVPWQHSSLCPPTSTTPCRQAVSPVVVLFSYHDGAPLCISVCEVQQQLHYRGLRCIAVPAGSASGDTAPMVGPRSIPYLPSFSASLLATSPGVELLCMLLAGGESPTGMASWHNSPSSHSIRNMLTLVSLYTMGLAACTTTPSSLSSCYNL